MNLKQTAVEKFGQDRTEQLRTELEQLESDIEKLQSAVLDIDDEV